MTDEERRDWDEYLAWTRGASPEDYDQAERAAWVRLEAKRFQRQLERSTRAPKPKPEDQPKATD